MTTSRDKLICGAVESEKEDKLQGVTVDGAGKCNDLEYRQSRGRGRCTEGKLYYCGRANLCCPKMCSHRWPGARVA
jgi:hypothetical protein